MIPDNFLFLFLFLFFFFCLGSKLAEVVHCGINKSSFCYDEISSSESCDLSLPFFIYTSLASFSFKKVPYRYFYILIQEYRSNKTIYYDEKREPMAIQSVCYL